jgi:hypothetical protein
MCQTLSIASKTARHNSPERGAALITVVLFSGLMLLASGALLLAATVTSSTTFDAETEGRAYYAAESGVQAALHVLRGRVAPTPLLVSPATDPGNEISFRKASELTQSNRPGDNTYTPRLSRWLNYSYPSNNPDRVPLGTDTYSPATGLAFSVTVQDVDSSEYVSYSTTCSINGAGNSITFGSGANTATITMTGSSVSYLDAYPAVSNRPVATIAVSVTGTGATVPADTRFAIAFNTTAPYAGTTTLRGTITPGTITSASMGGVSLDFDSQLAWLYGGAFNMVADPFTLNPPNTAGGSKSLTNTVTAPEPQRLLISSTGYGPRGARKQLDIIIRKNYFNAFTAPATLTLVGPSSGFVFDAGSSRNETYSGDDIASTAFIPPIGVTNNTNLATVINELENATPPFQGVVTNPGPQNVANDLPDFLTNTALCDDLVQSFRRQAQMDGRYFTTASSPTTFGNNATGEGLTFVDGNVQLTGNGGGILLVTGRLTLHGNFNFHGLILVLGGGYVDRTGGGNGVLEGNIIVAAYNPSNLAAGFTAPSYSMTGGGVSTVIFNSDSNANSQNAYSGFIMGVAEK